jgi:hypothetical protein
LSSSSQIKIKIELLSAIDLVCAFQALIDWRTTDRATLAIPPSRSSNRESPAFYPSIALYFPFLRQMRQRVTIFTIARLPWMTRDDRGDRDVSLLIPWLSLSDQLVVYPKGVTFRARKTLRHHICCLRHRRKTSLSNERCEGGYIQAHANSNHSTSWDRLFSCSASAIPIRI